MIDVYELIVTDVNVVTMKAPSSPTNVMWLGCLHEGSVTKSETNVSYTSPTGVQSPQFKVSVNNKYQSHRGIDCTKYRAFLCIAQNLDIALKRKSTKLTADG